MVDINTQWNTLVNWQFKDLIKASRLNAGQDNIKQLKDYIRGDNGEGTGVDGHTHNGINSLKTSGIIYDFDQSVSRTGTFPDNNWFDFSATDINLPLVDVSATKIYSAGLYVSIPGQSYTITFLLRVKITDGTTTVYSDTLNLGTTFNSDMERQLAGYENFILTDISTLDKTQQLKINWQWQRQSLGASFSYSVSLKNKVLFII